MASAAAVDKRTQSYRRISIYGTKSRLYVVGHDEQLGVCRILKFRRQDGPRLDVVEDPIVYSPEQCNLVLRKVHEQSGGLQLISKGHGIIGAFRFTDSFYLLVIARREYVGHICGHKVYRIAETCLISLSASQQRIDMAAADSTAEKRYRKLLLGVDLTKNFFFSYTYSLAHTLQDNHTQVAAAAAAASCTPNGALNSVQNGAICSATDSSSDAAAAAAAAAGWGVYDSSMFVWNAYLTRPLRAAIQSTRWTVPLIHGYWEQRQVSIFGRQLMLTLVGRRSRHFAGTRYRKRGLSAVGFVANEVETEQIVDAGMDWSTGQPLWSSMVQVRGSVPLFWSQQPTTLSPKPDVLLQQFDPVYEKTAAHFADLRRRYGNPIMALNLLKSKERRPRELLLRKEYGVAVNLINCSLPLQQRIIYIPWDFNRHAKQPGANILEELSPILDLCLGTSGIYVHGPASCATCQPAIQACFSSRAAAAAAGTTSSSNTLNPSRSAHQEVQQVQDATAAAATNSQTLNPTESSQLEAKQMHDTAAAAAHSPAPPPSCRPKRRLFAVQTQLQQGVLRTNCIDCLDRTNVVQFAYGLAAFGLQLAALGMLDSGEGEVDSDSSIALQLMEMYEGMGHTLALQYGGSEAHAAFFQKKRGEWDATTQSRDLMTSIRRFYSNAYTDAEKQDAINLFLGNYVPMPNAPPLWELTDDCYLHSDSAIRYSQLIHSDRLLAPAAAAAGDSSPAAAAAAAVTAGGRNAPVIIRQLSATTLPPAAFGFGNSVNSAAATTAAAAVTPSAGGSSIAAAAGGSGGAAAPRPAAAWISPFATAASNAAAAAAGSSSISNSLRGNTPLLHLTFSDGISVDSVELDGSPSSADGAFNFKLVFQQMLPAVEQAPAVPTEHHSELISLDNVLAKLPRTRHVRLYPVTARNNVMWEAVQQAFAFFSSSEAAAAGDGATAGTVGGCSSSMASAAAAAAVAAGGGGNNSSGDGVLSSIQTLDLTQQATKRQQQQQLPGGSSNITDSPTAGSSSRVPSSSIGPVYGKAGSSSSSSHAGPAAAAAAAADRRSLESPSSARAAAAAVSTFAQHFSSGGHSGTGFKTPPAPPVSGLNDILDIRTDVTPVRMISHPNKPPQAIGPHGPVIAPPTLLDATLDELMWSQFGINVSSTTTRQQQQQRSRLSLNPNSPGETGSGNLGSGFAGTRPGSPVQSSQGVADRVWGTLGVVMRGAMGGTTGSTAGGTLSGGTNATVSPLNDIIGVRHGSTGSTPGATAAAAGTGTVMLAGGKGAVSPARYSSSSNSSRPISAGTAVAGTSTVAASSSSRSGSGSGSGSSEQQPPAGPTAGRVTFTPAGLSSISSSYASAAATASRLHIGSTHAAPVSPTLSPMTSLSGSGGLSTTSPEWLVIDGHAVRMLCSDQQQQQGSAAADTPSSMSAAAAAWSSPFWKHSKRQVELLQPVEQQLTHSLQPQQLFAQFLGLQQLDAAAMAEQAAAAARREGHKAMAAAKLQRQQQQRIDCMRSMFMPVDAAATAAAFGLHPADTEPFERQMGTFSGGSGVEQQQQQQQLHCGTYWQSSAAVAGPTLQGWAARAEDVGLAPEVQAVWWGLGDMHEVWAVAEEGSREAYERYCRTLLRLNDEGSCCQLRRWYQQQQFQTPVILGAA